MLSFKEFITELFDRPLPFKLILNKNDGDINEDGVAYRFKTGKDTYLVTYYPHRTSIYDNVIKDWSSVEWVFSSKKLGTTQFSYET